MFSKLKSRWHHDAFCYRFILIFSVLGIHMQREYSILSMNYRQSFKRHVSGLTSLPRTGVLLV